MVGVKLEMRFVRLGDNLLDGLSVVALIPARMGSRGLPGKNTRVLAGRPLVSWTISAAIESKLIDEVLVSSNDPKVLSIAHEMGAEGVVRPDHLARDTTQMSEVVQHALSLRPFSHILVLLQPTSPLRNSHHIDEGLTLVQANSEYAVVSVCESETPAEIIFRRGLNGELQPVLPGSARRRQDFEPTLKLNGAFYASRTDVLRRCEGQFSALPLIPYIMDRRHSIDIDSSEDFEVAERYLEEGK